MFVRDNILGKVDPKIISETNVGSYDEGKTSKDRFSFLIRFQIFYNKNIS